jgi:hypothetical protein
LSLGGSAWLSSTAPACATGRKNSRCRSHLDDGHRHGEHQRPERLADPVRNDLGVVDCGEHGAAEQYRCDQTHHRPDVLAPGEHQ